MPLRRLRRWCLPRSVERWNHQWKARLLLRILRCYYLCVRVGKGVWQEGTSHVLLPRARRACGGGTAEVRARRRWCVLWLPMQTIVWRS